MEIIFSLVQTFGKDLSPGRMLESFILLAVTWSRLKPHLKKMEERLAGLESALTAGFKSGELRFERIEDRVTDLEKQKPHEGDFREDSV